MNKFAILVVEDDESQQRIIEYNLKQKGYEVTAVESAERGIEILRNRDFALLVSDMKLPGMDGMEFLKQARELKPEIPVLFITAFGTVEKAVEAMKAGAFDYITKPFDRDEFIMVVEKALEFQRLRVEIIRLRGELESHKGFSDMIGVSAAMQEVFATIEKVAATDATVLIMGESGTGKELVARAIHRASDRANFPLLTVNCAAIPRDLLESELFGHVSGAFTGAIKDKVGKFLAADGGTILLDEIGDLHLDLQAKLLRVIQEREVEPVGSNGRIAVDIRIIAATNQGLSAKVKNGEFREDLFYRLNVVPITIPPLRNRPDDIPLLLNHFIQHFSPGPPVTIDNNALVALTRYGWPGNVRELENIIKRVTIFSKDGRVKLSDLPPEISGAANGSFNGRPNQSALIEAEIKLVTDALKLSGWNQSRAAVQLGIPRHVLIYRMKKYGIREP
jgi:two-component system NtrC family response regulator